MSRLLSAWLCALALVAPSAGAAEQNQAPHNRYSAQLLTAINAYRAKHGVAVLDASPNLDTLAYEHSKDMAQAGRLGHEGYRERGTRSGSPVCVENVGWNYASPEAQLRAWVESPGHNKNLLDAKITKAGIGESRSYVTFLACR